MNSAQVDGAQVDGTQGETVVEDSLQPRSLARPLLDAKLVDDDGDSDEFVNDEGEERVSDKGEDNDHEGSKRIDY